MKEEEKGTRAEADLKQCSLSSWFAHPDGKGKKDEVQMGGKKSCGRHSGGDCGWDISDVPSRCWWPCVWKGVYMCVKVFLTPRNSMLLQSDFTWYGQWNFDSQMYFMENFPVTALHCIPFQLQCELITLSFNYVKAVMVHFQLFFFRSFILSVYSLMSRLMVVPLSSSVNQFLTSPDLAIMIFIFINGPLHGIQWWKVNIY